MTVSFNLSLCHGIAPDKSIKSVVAEVDKLRRLTSVTYAFCVISTGGSAGAISNRCLMLNRSVHILHGYGSNKHE